MPDTRRNIEYLKQHNIMLVSTDDLVIKDFTNLMTKLGLKVSYIDNLNADNIKEDADIILSELPNSITHINQYIESIVEKFSKSILIVLIDEDFDGDMLQQALLKGAKGYVEKPLNYIELVRTLTKKTKEVKETE